MSERSDGVPTVSPDSDAMVALGKIFLYDQMVFSFVTIPSLSRWMVCGCRLLVGWSELKWRSRSLYRNQSTESSP